MPGLSCSFSGSFSFLPGGVQMRDHRRTARPRRGAARQAAALTAATAAALAAAFLAGCSATPPPKPPPPVTPVPVPAAQLARLPAATTFGTTPGAPQDPAPDAPETGIVLHPQTLRPVYARPGGPAVAALPPTQLGSPTWVPVITARPGWDQVLLPARPDRSTGWIYVGGGHLQTAYTPYQIQVRLTTRQLTILDNSTPIGTWTVADGEAGTPTPAGRTFLLASLAPAHPTFSPLILPLGTHSATLATYGGGPGTVALHGWPDANVFGHPASHGCIRVPPTALHALSQIPLGTPVIITS
jgi:lipoprotein-anchoring transpeptidase ErfK/SrfK